MGHHRYHWTIGISSFGFVSREPLISDLFSDQVQRPFGWFQELETMGAKRRGDKIAPHSYRYDVWEAPAVDKTANVSIVQRICFSNEVLKIPFRSCDFLIGPDLAAWLTNFTPKNPGTQNRSTTSDSEANTYTWVLRTPEMCRLLPFPSWLAYETKIKHMQYQVQKHALIRYHPEILAVGKYRAALMEDIPSWIR